MAIFILMAFVGGVCVSLSRALNGRLSLATSPLAASLWNHVVGLAVLAAAATALAGGIGGPLALALDRAPATAAFDCRMVPTSPRARTAACRAVGSGWVSSRWRVASE